MKLYYDEKAASAAPEGYVDSLAEMAGAEKVCLAGDAAAGLEELHLEYTADGLSLVKGKLSLRGDFSELLPRLKPIKLENEMLVKAAKAKNAPLTPVLIDATAGMGEDSLLLAAAGFKVILCERDGVICALLRDTLARASKTKGLEAVARRMELNFGDSEEILRQAATEGKIPPDAVYLDPMFPEREKTGLIKKKFQLLQQLESPCSDEKALFTAANTARPGRILVKRPQKGPYLAGEKPDYTIDGKSVRYDIYLKH